MATEDGKPKVFISYSWGNATTVTRVNAVADFLEGNGVWVEMDRYQEPGSNLYRFMEQMVRDPSIDKVLCFCDRSYTQKAEAGQGGVGTEAAIITPEVYEQVKGNQDAARHRYVAVALETDDRNQFSLPLMFQSLMVVPMTDPAQDTEVYPELLRIAAGQPRRVRNVTSTLPEYLQGNATRHALGTEPKALLARMEARNQGARRATAALREYLEALSQGLAHMSPGEPGSRTARLDQEIQANRPVFQEFAQVVDAAAQFIDGPLEPTLYGFFQTLITHNFSYQVDRDRQDFTRLAATEFFVATITALIEHRRFDQAAGLLTRAYWERAQDREARGYELLCYGPEDLHDDRWLEQTRRALRQASGLDPAKYNQADALLHLRGAFHRSYRWHMTLVSDWIRSGLPVTREVTNAATAAPLETLLDLPLARIVQRLDDAATPGQNDPLAWRTGVLGGPGYLMNLEHLKKAL
ncbi:toll/interleukin-1 receptor domain-containing protein [Deinococcus enclensis]|uniref:SEFIR domain-containing protein n=1 Tax=Deinococcus enclensis TaxID=1049582 RepID=A0ABT9MIU7_9DEIO|nr:toll/interleukin-1 receptor domain-containing protein [Deinococcus enclensis]MDP9766523.1 hypothetical protein [Deinococcus enclensis]